MSKENKDDPTVNRGWMNPVGPDPDLYPDPPKPETGSDTPDVGSGSADVGSGTADVGSGSAEVGSGTAKPKSGK